MSESIMQGCSAITPTLAVQVSHPLLDEIRALFQASQYSAIRKLRVESFGGSILLHGKVPSFYNRQVALNLASNVAGEERITDHIQVASLDQHK